MKQFRLFLPLILLSLLSACSQPAPLEGEFADKVDLLWRQVQEGWEDPGVPPAGDAGYAVFFSVSDGTKKASVRSARGRTLEEAWERAAGKANELIPEVQDKPSWVKVDIVDSIEILTGNQVINELMYSADCSYRKGLSFDRKFETALLEEELNGSLIYNYEYGDLTMESMTDYYRENGRKPLKKAPDEFIAFQCSAWFCDENNEVYQLSSWQQNKGQRQMEVTGESAREMIEGSADYLARQVQDDGKFIYDYYPQYDMDTGSYNMVRHAGTVWSMVQAYSLFPSKSLASSIRGALDYLKSQMVYDDERGHIFDESEELIFLGSDALAALALVEYQEVFKDNSYQDTCLSLGESILAALDEETGEFYHVLDREFNGVEKTRTVYYDGEATFALVRLYGLTGDERYLAAAESAVDHFIEADYIQYRDHWVEYSVNELTKYVDDNPAYWNLLMRNALDNLDTINRMYSSPTNFELLMNAFDAYTRMPSSVMLSDEEKAALFDAISLQVKKSSGDFFYPEYAMYMANPPYILNSFMMRDAGCRTRIDDVQHNIGAFFLFQQSYDKMVTAGVPASIVE